MQFSAMFLATLVGASLVVQIGLNAVVRSHLASNTATTLVNFAAGTLALLALALATRTPMPSAGQIGAVPWWAWLGGVLGAFYVASSTVLGPLLGGAAFVALAVGGQMLASLLVDHYGWLGFPQRPVDAGRMLGAVLMVAGVVLLTRR